MGSKHRLTLLLAGATVLAVSVALISGLLQRSRRDLSAAAPTRQDVAAAPQASPQDLIAPARPPDGRVVPAAPPAKHPAPHQTGPAATLTYDPAQSFVANIERFRLFCDADADPRTLEGRVKEFVAQLLEHAKANGPTIKAALLAKHGSPLVRNVLLACLMQTDLDDKQDIAWATALDQAENASVRRTAAFVLKELPEVRAQPQQLLRLLADPDDQVKVFALQSASTHMNADVYRSVQNLASTSPDIHVRVAALSAIGETANVEKNAYLTELIEDQQTSAGDKFSEASLVKRAAIAALDVSSPDAYATAQSAALDAEEDPGVRRRAILKCAQTPRPDTLGMLTSLLRASSSEDALIIKACVQGLQSLNEPAGIQAIQDKLAQTQDPEIRALINHLLTKEKE